MAGKKTLINLTLIDGTADGTLKCINKVQDGVIFRINRDDVNNHMNMPEMKQCGIYFLFGKKNGKAAVYIGQANTRKNGNGVLGRVAEHKKPQEDFWNQAFVLISSGNTIGATELNYLENQFCNMAINAGVYEIVNAADPNTGNYSDEVEITMDPLIEYTATCLKVLGYDLFTASEVVEEEVDPYAGCLKLFMNRDGGERGIVDARVVKQGEQYILLKNSMVAVKPTTSCPKDVRKQREEILADKVDKSGKVTEDVAFNSPSGVSQFVMYAASNGKIDLKDETGKTLKELL